MTTYTEWQEEQKRANAPAALNLRLGAEANPDEAADTNALARRFRVSPDVIDANPELFKPRAIAEDAAAPLANSPKASAWYGTAPQNAKVAKDDTGVLATIGSWFEGLSLGRNFRASPQDLATGSIGTAESVTRGADWYASNLNVFGWAYQLATGRTLLAKTSQHLQKVGADQQARADAIAGPAAKGWVAGGLNTAARSSAPMLAALEVGFVNPIAGLATIGTTTGGQSYVRAGVAGLEGQERFQFAARDGLIEAATERLPFSHALRDIAAGTPFAKRFMKNLLEENIGEQAATHLQDLNQWAAIDANKGKTFQDYINERPRAFVETLIAATASTGAMQSAVSGAQYAARRAAGRDAADERSIEGAERIREIIDLAAQSKTRERDPVSFADFMEHVTEGGPIAEVYVDAKELSDILEQGGLEAQALAAALPSVQAQIAEALETGGDVRIPISELATALPGHKLEQSIVDQLRVDPLDQSPAAREKDTAAAVDRLRQDFDEKLVEATKDADFAASRDAVTQGYLDQLNAAKRFTPEKNADYAQLLGSFMSVQAAKLGITPEEMAKRYPLQVRSLAGEATREEARFGNDGSAQERPLAPENLPDETLAALPLDTPAAADGSVQLPLAEPERAALREHGIEVSDDNTIAPESRAKLVAERDRRKAGGQRVELLDQDFAPSALVGLPRNAVGPNPIAQEAAADYMAAAGLAYLPPESYVTVDAERAKRIAQAFEDMKHAPQDPLVKAAYAAMIKETLAQWQVIKATGLTVEFIEGEDPYGAPRDAIEDVRDNNHLWVFPTDSGFGSGELDVSDNPLLAFAEGETIGGKPARVNDIFRIVHDYFGHIKEGVGFRAIGEENAWRSHSAMYSPLARMAMTTETRGQNSWVNYGPHGEANRTASSAETKYADQKIGLLPQWVVFEGANDSRTAGWTPERVDAMIDRFGYADANKTSAWVVMMSPEQFLGLTLDRIGRKTLASFDPAKTRARALSPEALAAEGQPIFLDVTEAYEPSAYQKSIGVTLIPWNVIGHEGRHRMTALMAAGVTQVPVVIRGAEGGKARKPIGRVTLNPQRSRLDPANNGDTPATVDNLVPLSKAYREQVANLFGETPPAVLFQAEPFYSAVVKAVSDSKMQKASGQQWAATIKNTPGVKQEELEWKGLAEWLSAHDKPIGKKDLLSFLADSDVYITQTLLGEPQSRAYTEALDERIQKLIDEETDEAWGNEDWYVNAPYISQRLDDNNENVEAWVFNDEDYESEEAAEEAREQFIEDQAEELRRQFFENYTTHNHAEHEETAKQELAEEGWIAPKETVYGEYSFGGKDYREMLFSFAPGIGSNPEAGIEDPHWGETVDDLVFAHVRFSTTRDTAGNKVLRLEELQSDWHQKGAAEGYKTDDGDVDQRARQVDLLTEFETARRARQEAADVVVDRARLLPGWTEAPGTGTAILRDRAFSFARQHIDEPGIANLLADVTAATVAQQRVAEALAILNNEIDKGAPDAPFKSTWPALVMRRMIRYAVDNGFDRIAWITGDQQNGGKTVRRFGPVYAVKTEDGRFTIETENDQVRSALFAKIANLRRGNVSKKDDTRSEAAIVGIQGLNLTADEMKAIFNVYHTKLGDEIIANATEDVEVFDGRNIGIEDDGHFFYDRNLVNITNGIIKKHGAKVEPMTFVPKEQIRVAGFTRQQLERLVALPAVTAEEVIRLREERAAAAEALQAAADAHRTETARAARVARDADDWIPDNPSTTAQAYREARDASHAATIAHQQAVERYGAEERLAELMREEAAMPANPGFVIPPSLATVASEQGFPLFQKTRGYITFGRDVTATPSTITLLNASDLSTFLHEAGHFFLEVTAHMASQQNAPPSVVADFEAALKWMGVPGGAATWASWNIEQKRKYHEKFARGFEGYLFEGKSPSIEMRGIFRNFARWIRSIYKQLTNLDAKLDPEIRGVFDRMLASEAAIAEAQADAGFKPVFTEQPEGMTDREWEDYQALGAAATETAVEELQLRSIRDMRFAARAHARALKKLVAQAKEQRAEVEAEVTEEIDALPVFRALDFVKRGLLNGEPVEGPHKFDVTSFDALYEGFPKEDREAVKKALGFGKYGAFSKDNGVNPEQIAELFGFSSADELITAMINAPDRATEIEAATDLRVLERYGDITSPQAMEAAAAAAIHNGVRARFVAAELAALSKAYGKPRDLAAAAKKIAQAMIARLRVRDIRPSQYEAAERRAAAAALAAVAKADTALAASEKRNQLINIHAAREARRTIDEVRAAVEYFRKFDNPKIRKRVDPAYVDQIEALLERFELRASVSGKEMTRRASLAAWITSQRERGFEPLISEDLENEAFRKHYRDMTVEELRDLRDAIKNIEHLGRLKSKLLANKEERELSVARDKAAATIVDNAYKDITQPLGAKTWLEHAKTGINDYLAMHRKLASMVREMDGFKDGGTLWGLITRPINEADQYEVTETEKATIALGKIFARLKKGTHKRRFVPALNRSISHETRLMFALNWGNEANRQRVLDGDRLSDAQVTAIFADMTVQDWAFIQETWDFIGSYWPAIAAKQTRLDGVAPERVEPAPFEATANDGSVVSLRGGYFPIKYDPDKSSKVEADTAAEVQRQIMGGLYGKATTRRGHTKARKDKVERSLRKDFGVIFEHVTQVIHDLAWHETLIDVTNILTGANVDAAIRDHYGPETLRWMNKAIMDIAAGSIPAQSSLERGVNYLRTGATIAGLGWNLVTSLFQPLGLFQSVQLIGFKYVGTGIGRVFADAATLKLTTTWIFEQSEFMRLRAKTYQREVSEIRNMVSGKSAVRNAVEASYFVLIAKFQLIADVPTWVGGYEKAIDQGNDHDRAVRLADQAVIDSQGSGTMANLAGVQRGGPFMKLWTNFYSYFSVTYNRGAEAVNETKKVGPSHLPLLAIDFLLLMVIPCALTTLLRMGVKWDWPDDEEELAKKLANDQAAYMLGTMFGARELGAIFGVGRNYTGPAGARALTAGFDFGKQVQQGDADQALIRAANNVGGVVLHYPAGQVDRTVRGTMALAEGETRNPLVPFVGPPKK